MTTTVQHYEPGDCTRYVMVLTMFEAGSDNATRLGLPQGGFILLVENMGVHLT